MSFNRLGISVACIHSFYWGSSYKLPQSIKVQSWHQNAQLHRTLERVPSQNSFIKYTETVLWVALINYITSEQEQENTHDVISFLHLNIFYCLNFITWKDRLQTKIIWMENKWWSPSIYDSMKSLFTVSCWKIKGFPNLKNNLLIRDHVCFALFPLIR